MPASRVAASACESVRRIAAASAGDSSSRSSGISSSGSHCRRTATSAGSRRGTRAAHSAGPTRSASPAHALPFSLADQLLDLAEELLGWHHRHRTVLVMIPRERVEGRSAGDRVSPLEVGDEPVIGTRDSVWESYAARADQAPAARSCSSVSRSSEAIERDPALPGHDAVAAGQLGSIQGLVRGLEQAHALCAVVGRCGDPDRDGQTARRPGPQRDDRRLGAHRIRSATSMRRAGASSPAGTPRTPRRRSAPRRRARGCSTSAGGRTRAAPRRRPGGRIDR